MVSAAWAFVQLLVLARCSRRSPATTPVLSLTDAESRQVEELLALGSPVIAWRGAHGGLELRALAPRNEVYSVGRAETADVCVSASDVSAAHALLRVVSARDVYAVDDGSLNGTSFEGGTLRQRRRMRDGSLLRLGASSYVLIRLAGKPVGTVPVDAPARLSDLSARQLEVLWWLAEPMFARGKAQPATRGDLCEGLAIAQQTVGEHLALIAKVLGVEGGDGLSVRLARRAIDLGIADIPRPGTGSNQ